MENVNYVSREINKDDELVLMIENVAFYGTLEVLKGIIEDHIDGGGDIEECHIGEYRPLLGVDIEAKREVSVPIGEVDEEYGIQDEEFVIYVKGRDYDRFSGLAHALECIEQLLVEDKDLNEEEVSIIRQVVYDCSYEVEIETKVDITIPPQIETVSAPPITQTGGIDWESKSSLVLMQELKKIQDILYKRENEKTESGIHIERADEVDFIG